MVRGELKPDLWKIAYKGVMRLASTSQPGKVHVYVNAVPHGVRIKVSVSTDLYQIHTGAIC